MSARPDWIVTRERVFPGRYATIEYLIRGKGRHVVTVDQSELTPENITRIGQALVRPAPFEPRRRYGR